MITGDPSLGKSVEPGNTIGKDGVIQQGTPSGPPHEGSRETYEGRIVSVPRDYCWTPAGSGKILIGYKIWAFQREATNLADSVTQTSLRSHVKGSIVTRCYGDEAGTLGGIISGTHNSWCTPKTWSETVTFEGRNAVRDSDEWWMNRFNTWGVLDYKKNMNQYSTDDPKTIDARMYLAFSEGETEPPGGNMPPSVNRPTEIEPTGPGLSYGTGAAGGGEPAEVEPQTQHQLYLQNLPSSAWTEAGAYWQAPDGTLIPKDQFQYIMSTRQSKGKTQTRTGTPPPPRPRTSTQTNVVRQTGSCRRQIGIYKSLTCSNSNDQKHHYPSDFTMGAGSGDRQVNVGRFPNMPNYGDMPAICLQGGTSLADEHGQIQQAVDNQIGKIQTPSGAEPGTAKLGDVIKTAIDTIAADPRVGPQCRAQLQRFANQAFAGKNMDQLVRSQKYGMPATSTNYLSKIPPPTYSDP